MTDSDVNGRLYLSVTAKEERLGLFIIHPVGSINTNTYPISEDHLKTNAIHPSGPHIKDAKVLDALCREAIETDNHRFREALIQILKSNPDEANRRFSQMALCHCQKLAVSFG
jgi:hypothetical protein